MGSPVQGLSTRARIRARGQDVTDDNRLPVDSVVKTPEGYDAGLHALLGEILTELRTTNALLRAALE